MRRELKPQGCLRVSWPSFPRRRKRRRKNRRRLQKPCEVNQPGSSPEESCSEFTFISFDDFYFPERAELADEVSRARGYSQSEFLAGRRGTGTPRPGPRISGNMNVNDVSEATTLERSEVLDVRTRLAPPTALIVGTALLSQLMVLSSIAIIMGVAVVTMCALVVELLVLTIVATILERGVVEVEDLGTLMEVTATVLVTVVTLVLASFSRAGTGGKSELFVGSPIAATRLS